jgi:hypothetical protein
MAFCSASCESGHRPRFLQLLFKGGDLRAGGQRRAASPARSGLQQAGEIDAIVPREFSDGSDGIAIKFTLRFQKEADASIRGHLVLGEQILVLLDDARDRLISAGFSPQLGHSSLCFGLPLRNVLLRVGLERSPFGLHALGPRGRGLDDGLCSRFDGICYGGLVLCAFGSFAFCGGLRRGAGRELAVSGAERVLLVPDRLKVGVDRRIRVCICVWRRGCGLGGRSGIKAQIVGRARVDRGGASIFDCHSSPLSRGRNPCRSGEGRFSSPSSPNRRRAWSCGAAVRSSHGASFPRGGASET